MITNTKLNEMFPLAGCPRSSLDDQPEADWYLRDLSSRFLAAFGIGDTQTMEQIQARLAVHRACRDVRGMI